MASASPPLFVRRLRALWRKLSASRPRPQPPGPGAPMREPERPSIHGFVDGCVAGEIRGWALDRRQPGRRVHVVALCDGAVVAEALADLSRMDLVRSGHGDGRHAFRLRLPPALLDGAPRKIEVEAALEGPRVRLAKGEIEVRGGEPEAEAPATAPAPAASRAGPSASVLDAPQTPPAALVVWGAQGEAGLARTRASAQAQAGGSFELVDLEGARASGQRDAIRRKLASAGTVALVRAGEALDPALARTLAHARPLGDVVTWETGGPGGRRPEARALGVLLGEDLGGAFAVRGHALGSGGAPVMDALLGGDIGRLELLLAARPELRWSHLPAALSSGPAGDAAGAGPPSGFALPGYRRGRGGLVPDAVPGRWTLGVWPAWTPAAQSTLRSLLAIAPQDVEIELLADVRGAQALREDGTLAAPGGRLTVRAVDVAAGSGAGGWLQALGAAATGDVLVVCQAGLEFEGGAEALQDLAAWSQSPLVGGATADIRPRQGAPLGGLAATRLERGWAAVSAYDPAMAGRRRPVLAAPAAFLAVGRDKLAALGGFDGGRLDGDGCDMELGLRLRRAGAASVLFGDLAIGWTAPGRPAGEAEGAALAAFDAGELASAADAYPPPGDGG